MISVHWWTPACKEQSKLCLWCARACKWSVVRVQWPEKREVLRHRLNLGISPQQTPKYRVAYSYVLLILSWVLYENHSISHEIICNKTTVNFYHLHEKLFDTVKGSVERSLFPWAIFLIFTRNRPWKSEDHLCTLFIIEMSKERVKKKRKNTAGLVAGFFLGQFELACRASELACGS